MISIDQAFIDLMELLAGDKRAEEKVRALRSSVNERIAELLEANNRYLQRARDAETPKPTKLYLIDHDVEDVNLDLVVEASDPDQAIELWRAWDFATFHGIGQDDQPCQVFELPLPTGGYRVLGFHHELRRVGGHEHDGACQ